MQTLIGHEASDLKPLNFSSDFFQFLSKVENSEVDHSWNLYYDVAVYD